MTLFTFSHAEIEKARSSEGRLRLQQDRRPGLHVGQEQGHVRADDQRALRQHHGGQDHVLIMLLVTLANRLAKPTLNSHRFISAVDVEDLRTSVAFTVR